MDVTCFGEVLWDFYQQRNAEQDGFTCEIGGSPANTAVGLRRLGIGTALWGAVGQDFLGVRLRDALAREGIDVSGVILRPERTGLAFVTRDAAGEPRYCFYRQSTADARHAVGDLPSTLHAAYALLGTSTLHTPELVETTFAFVARATAARATLLLDLNVRVHLWDDAPAIVRRIEALAAEASIVKGNEHDFAAVAGSGEAARNAWLEAHAPTAVWVVTRGAEGAKVGWLDPAGRRRWHEQPAAQAVVVETTGAGDALQAGLLATLVHAQARPGTPRWHCADVWRAALAIGVQLAAKAVSANGAVAGLRQLEPLAAEMQRRVRELHNVAGRE